MFWNDQRGEELFGVVVGYTSVSVRYTHQYKSINQYRRWYISTLVSTRNSDSITLGDAIVIHKKELHSHLSEVKRKVMHDDDTVIIRFNISSGIRV